MLLKEKLPIVIPHIIRQNVIIRKHFFFLIKNPLENYGLFGVKLVKKLKEKLKIEDNRIEF